MIGGQRISALPPGGCKLLAEPLIVDLYEADANGEYREAFPMPANMNFTVTFQYVRPGYQRYQGAVFECLRADLQGLLGRGLHGGIREPSRISIFEVFSNSSPPFATVRKRTDRPVQHSAPAHHPARGQLYRKIGLVFGCRRTKPLRSWSLPEMHARFAAS